ncbi:hypothetical protein SEA_SATIS_303 [Streptomyces phage Satis]|nr:hypothetical protein SEA_SATIS_303 [Streptomyces phage Satis]
MNETTKRIIEWIWGERKLADFLRGIAEGEKIPPHHEAFDYGDDQLACWISDFVFPEDRGRGIKAWIDIEGDDARADALYEALTEGRKTPAGRLKWLDEMDVELVRDALLGHKGGSDIYVHSLVRPYHPNNTYRVHDSGTVYERGWTSASGAWGLAESDRQVCLRPTDPQCGCAVVQRG